jgi:hypothetical protein
MGLIRVQLPKRISGFLAIPHPLGHQP